MIYAVNQEEVRRRKALAYTRELTKNSDGTWFARIVEFPGCMTEGETAEETLSNLDDAMGLWIETRLEDGEPIPEPLSTDAYSGKFLVRVPKGLHREIARRAELEGVSLNLFVSVALARAVGEKSAIDRSSPSLPDRKVTVELGGTLAGQGEPEKSGTPGKA